MKDKSYLFSFWFLSIWVLTIVCFVLAIATTFGLNPVIIRFWFNIYFYLIILVSIFASITLMFLDTLNEYFK